MTEQDTFRHLTRTPFGEVRVLVYTELNRQFRTIGVEVLQPLKSCPAAIVILEEHGWTVDELLKADNEYWNEMMSK